MFYIFLVIAYLCGSLSAAILICKVARLPDPRTSGSGNPGASNMLRLHGKPYAILTLIGDILKGVVPVGLAMVFGVTGFWLAFVALAAVIGHMYPLFFKFRGGKGVATAVGCYLILSPFMGVVVIAIWIILVGVFRYASLASLVACIAAPFIALVFHPAYFIGLAVIAVLVVWRHRSNIKLLQTRREKKLF